MEQFQQCSKPPTSDETYGDFDWDFHKSIPRSDFWTTLVAFCVRCSRNFGKHGKFKMGSSCLINHVRDQLGVLAEMEPGVSNKKNGKQTQLEYLSQKLRHTRNMSSSLGNMNMTFPPNGVHLLTHAWPETWMATLVKMPQLEKCGMLFPKTADHLQLLLHLEFDAFFSMLNHPWNCELALDHCYDPSSLWGYKQPVTASLSCVWTTRNFCDCDHF